MEAKEVTNNLICSVEDGFVTWEDVARACLSYMSEEDVKDMCRLNGFNCYADDEEEVEESEESVNLYYICVEHPSRDHIVIPNKIKDDVITVKDNFVSQAKAILFTSYEDALKASKKLKSKCKTYIKQIGKVALTYLDQLIKVKTSIGKAYIQQSSYDHLKEEEQEYLIVKKEKAFLAYLKRKSKVCSLDKADLADYYYLSEKYNKN